MSKSIYQHILFIINLLFSLENTIVPEIDSFCKSHLVSDKFSRSILDRFKVSMDRSMIKESYLDFKKRNEETKLSLHERKIKMKQIQIFIDTRSKEIKSYRENIEKVKNKNIQLNAELASHMKYSNSASFKFSKIVLILMIFLMALYMSFNKLNLINF